MTRTRETQRLSESYAWLGIHLATLEREFLVQLAGGGDSVTAIAAVRYLATLVRRRRPDNFLRGTVTRRGRRSNLAVAIPVTLAADASARLDRV